MAWREIVVQKENRFILHSQWLLSRLWPRYIKENKEWIKFVKILILMWIYEYFSWCFRDPRTKGLRAPSPFFRITRKISPFETCHFKIIARNIKAIFRENFSLLRLDAGKIFKITTFIRAPRATYCTITTCSFSTMYLIGFPLQDSKVG